MDRRRATKNRLREQFGIDFSRLVVPRWLTAERPTVPVQGDFGLNEDTGRPESYNGTAWVSASSSEAVTFTKTSSFTYAHNRGVYPSVSVFLSNGVEVYVEVVHNDANSVTISFNGTLTNAVMVLA